MKQEECSGNEEQVSTPVEAKVEGPKMETIQLSRADILKLIDLLDWCRCFVNTRTRESSIDLLEKIQTQFTGVETYVEGSPKHRRLRPQDFQKEEEERHPAGEYPAYKEKEEKKRGFWGRLFGKK